jgi:hypothetical protein
MVMSVPVLAASELSVQRQYEIIANYMYANGMDIPANVLAASEVDFDDGDYRHHKCGTPAIMEFLHFYDQLDKEILKELALVLKVRPDMDHFRDSDAGLFRIHYNTSGTSIIFEPTKDLDGNGHPDCADNAADIMDSVYWYIIDTLGYPAPPKDGYEPGGDDKYDVYLVSLGVGLYGQTWKDSTLDDFPESITATSFLELQNDYSTFSNYVDRPLDAFRVTAAHEFFHAVQFGIDFTETEYDSDNRARPYWVELSATWMEDEIYDDINDYFYYLDAFFENPAVSLQSVGSSIDLHPYSSVVWALYMSERFGRDIISDIWLRCAEPGPTFLEATQLAIDSVSGGGENWASIFSEFALASYFVGDNYDYLPVEVRKTRHWQCEAGTFPDNCTDSSIVIDTTEGYDWTSIDTSLFSGFSEGAEYPDWYWRVWDPAVGDFVEKDPFHKYYDYPAYLAANVNADKPQHNGMYFLELYNLAQIPYQVGYWNCNDGVWPACTDSSRVRDTTLGYDFTYTDTAINTWFFFGDGKVTPAIVPTLPQGWGFNMLYQVEPPMNNPGLDSIFVENRLVPDDYLFHHQEYDRDTYRSLRFVLSPASPNLEYFDNLMYRLMDLGYLVGDTIIFDPARANLPSAVLSPYPNPVIVDEMNDPRVTFEFQVVTDDSSRPVYYSPNLIVDVFSLAGERVATVSGISSSAQRYLGIHRAVWDLKNDRGTDVAAGVYIAYGRLMSKARKGAVLAADHKKIAVIR